MRDYNLLARAVACPVCGAKKGERCRGANLPHIKGTHYKRRGLASKARRETP
jgi:hypothetical protein